MATPQRNAENFLNTEGDTTEHMDSFLKSMAKLRSLSVEDSTETGKLRSRIDEQSSLICMLKQRADELLLRCEALQKINTELEGCMKDCQTELDSERKKADLIEKRFMDLASNNQAIIAFMDEYKNQNGLLKLENKELQAENDTLFSQKLQDKEVCVQNLMQEIKQMTEKCINKENEYGENLVEYQSKLQEQGSQHQAKEAVLLGQLHDTQQQQRDADEMCRDLKLKLQKAGEEHAQREIQLTESITSLTREKDTLLDISMERGKLIQEKQEEIQQLEMKLKEEKKARAKAEDRFQKEAEAVNTNLKVKSLQSALDEATTKNSQFTKDFEAYKEHSSNLLIQERELNKKLRHMMG
ncbi:coiled-coil domain-containing protein 89 [Notolabrus celidotus]|uniref:coiled-coil domain-containing protein 89 n=1 Tax=Notolabrus celidotus TaxID=1203425 RepID=UPI00148FEB4E|nr:coiled-coil domain-containing protein 89 [Notolabrus celidotus]